MIFRGAQAHEKGLKYRGVFFKKYYYYYYFSKKKNIDMKGMKIL